MVTYNGVGTKLYGVSDINREEGSYIATKWIVVFYLPLIPLASYRVIPGESKNFGVYRNRTYRMTKVPMHWDQIRKLYLKVYGIIAVIIAIIFMVKLFMKQ